MRRTSSLSSGTQNLAHNVGAMIPGTDPVEIGAWVVIGAHFDHICINPERSRDPERGVTVRPGADDSASGTAAVLALAARFAQNPSRYSLFFVNVDAEEVG